MTSLWEQFDEDVDQILEVRGDADGKLRAMTTIIVSIAAEWFGEEEKKGSRTPYSKNKSGEDPQHQAVPVQVPVQGDRRRGTHWLCSADVHPMKEDQGSPPGRVASEAAA